MIVSSKPLLESAYGGFAVGSYSVNTLEQVRAVFEGNVRADAPFILGTSHNARSYAGARLLEGVLRGASEEFPDAVFAVHLDHGDEDACMEALESGIYTSIMIDASMHPFEENVAITRRVVERAHDRGVSVEAELGTLSGVEDDVRVEANLALLTDPDQAAEFVARTRCDCLAVAIGTSHGAYKFTGEQRLRVDRLAAIEACLPDFPLVLHGASSVPAEEVRRINAAGGQLDEGARGVDPEDFAAVIEHGITKINIDTDSRLVWTRVHREHFRDHPENIDPRKPGEQFMHAYAELIEERSQALRSAGQSSGVREYVQAVSNP